MLNETRNITELVTEEIRTISRQASLEDGEIIVKPEHSLIQDLGLSSLMLARLIMELGAKLETDPFSELCHISDIRTVADLINAYVLAEEHAVSAA
ncbi:MAG TPA: acyl carrier protein [Burkholderiaceae bacterium]|jgi:acyl carrier protein|nr:acyl carrier protein [Burkholderiaceae bacterium]